jgi:hypothetical protein
MPAEPLPPDFDRELREIDALLQASAARTSIPRDLADTVYDATVGLLWRRQAPIPLRATRSPVWSQLAMAASLGLAFLVAAVFMRAPDQMEQPVSLGVLPVEAERLLFEPSVDYLLDTRDLTYTDLLGDLERLERELEL